MHAMRLLEKWLQRNAVVVHRTRLQTLVRVVGALLSGGKLALTHLGRHREGRAFVKHHVKAVDRLLGNPHLYSERHGVYGALAQTVVGGVARPIILVDWAGLPFLASSSALLMGPTGCSVEQRPPYSQTTPSPSPSRMYRYAGCDRCTGAIPCRRASLHVILPLRLSS